MKKQAFNPYLPSYEYVPDGEPYVFDGRLYVYGSHDCFGADEFCANDYVGWSADVNDLGNWRYEGVIYRAGQDPLNPKKEQKLYAPDMQKGPDGRYYLYYALNRSPVISVAVCDQPAGDFEFYGHVKLPDGTVFGTRSGDINNFDPGIFMDDDNRVYLYTGFSPGPGFLWDMLSQSGRQLEGAYCVELAQDMLTVISQPVLVAPGPSSKNPRGFEGHEFFEASSLRKINGVYYFVYSSINGHELCYATGARPDEPFTYRGTLVSNGDIFLNGNTVPQNYTGNTHGGLVEINGTWYVFYHRQTNLHQFSRQGCAEPLTLSADGSFEQAEMTSCGLNGGPLAATGEYEARIASSLVGPQGAYFYDVKENEAGTHPYFTQSGADRQAEGDQYIANLQNGAWAAFKYFAFAGESEITLTTRGSFAGSVEVATTPGGTPVAVVPVTPSKGWQTSTAPLAVAPGTHPLYFTFKGAGAADFTSFTMQ